MSDQPDPDALRPEDLLDDEDPSAGLLGWELEAAVGRLEDVLLAQPYDRALPDLDDLLDRAGIPAAVVRRDDRALKALREAVLARPFAQLDEVVAARVEVELLTLEVEVLTDQLRSGEIADRQLGVTSARLREVRDLLDRLHGQL
ncbi:hypothetical protein FTX61_12685 [Nitriliruptoraceae bacterium ZYF776]|nr:hypothetical protein [Profundirhabdus halotolerans]